VAIYEVGCLIGALSNLWVGDRLGRRRTIVVGGVVMIVGAILQAASYSYAQMLVARVITGLGNGLNVSRTALPTKERLTERELDVDCASLPCRVLSSDSEGSFNYDRRQSDHFRNYGCVRAFQVIDLHIKKVADLRPSQLRKSESPDTPLQLV